MSSVNMKLESGTQLLARLTKKFYIQNFYPLLFNTGPGPNEIIELHGEINTRILLQDIVCEALMFQSINGARSGVLLLNTDGNFNFKDLIHLMRTKIIKKSAAVDTTSDDVNKTLQELLNNLHILEIYGSTQFYTTIHNLETILLKYPNISLIIFDTLTAFYWSEQRSKITKMDIYVKNLLGIIQKITKDYQVSILFTRPEYFTSTKESFGKLEPCGEQQPATEQINYRIQLVCNKSDNLSYQVLIKTSKNNTVQNFKVTIGQVILWQ